MAHWAKQLSTVREVGLSAGEFQVPSAGEDVKPKTLNFGRNTKLERSALHFPRESQHRISADPQSNFGVAQFLSNSICIENFK